MRYVDPDSQEEKLKVPNFKSSGSCRTLHRRLLDRKGTAHLVQLDNPLELTLFVFLKRPLNALGVRTFLVSAAERNLVAQQEGQSAVDERTASRGVALEGQVSLVVVLVDEAGRQSAHLDSEVDDVGFLLKLLLALLGASLHDPSPEGSLGLLEVVGNLPVGVEVLAGDHLDTVQADAERQRERVLPVNEAHDLVGDGVDNKITGPEVGMGHEQGKFADLVLVAQDLHGQRSVGLHLGFEGEQERDQKRKHPCHDGFVALVLNVAFGQGAAERVA